MNYGLDQEIRRLREPSTNRPDFKRALFKVGTYLGHGLANQLEGSSVEIQTSTGGIATHRTLLEEVAIIGVLRAGLPLAEGLHEVFPEADYGFVGAMRDEQTLESTISYAALPKMTGKTVLVADTMLGTGGTMKQTIDLILEQSPKQVFAVSAIAAADGVLAVQDHYRTGGQNISMLMGVIDPVLNEKGYIVPGCGDAGDRCYGPKLDLA